MARIESPIIACADGVQSEHVGQDQIGHNRWPIAVGHFVDIGVNELRASLDRFRPCAHQEWVGCQIRMRNVLHTTRFDWFIETAGSFEPIPSRSHLIGGIQINPMVEQFEFRTNGFQCLVGDWVSHNDPADRRNVFGCVLGCDNRAFCACQWFFPMGTGG